MFNFFKRKRNSLHLNADLMNADNSDDEYQLSILSKGNFQMTSELYARMESEKLKMKHGIHTIKEGSLL